MKHLSYEAGRRRRFRLLTTWVLAVLVAGAFVGTQAPRLPGELAAAGSFLFIASILVPVYLVRRRNEEVSDWYFHGRCLTCGFDLHRNDDRCPECGRPSGPFKL